MIESSEAHCRLSSDFLLTTDLENANERANGGFMPGHEGEWFDEIRLETIDADITVPTVIDHYVSSLRWFAANDPQSMYAMLAATPAMARSVSYHELGTLLEQTGRSKPPTGWHAFWLGTVKRDLEECRKLLRFALKGARETNDLALASEVCVELGRVYSRTGFFDKAIRVCDIADEIATRSATKVARKNAMRLRGTVDFYWHKPKAGHATFIKLEDELDCPIELASLMHLRSFLEASMGWFDQAEETQTQADIVGRRAGHFRTGILTSTTTAMLKAARGKRSEARQDLESLAVTFYANEVSQFGVYADELVAKLHRIEGNHVAADHALQSAKRERVRSHMAVTPIEQRRIATLR